MGNNVVWFEVMGSDAAKLHGFYGGLFGWELAPVPGDDDYKMVSPTGEGAIPGGVGKAPGGPGWTTFYVGVDDVAVALAGAQKLGGKLVQDVTELPGGLVVAMFADPEGHLVGLVRNQVAA